jgi:hypothetical protein
MDEGREEVKKVRRCEVRKLGGDGMLKDKDQRWGYKLQ